ncbi:MAG: hypothetical protein H7308_19800 [Chthonomonadaceae bacterium]|nr:hypothetical protein [Chthonomonadaceae bacterium]
MTPVESVAEIRVRLAETIAWCRNRASLEDPKNCLRTLALRPSNLSETANEWNFFDYDWKNVEENRAVLSRLSSGRAELLRAENAHTDSLPSDLAGGRLLISIPDWSDFCGLTEAETQEFTDTLDIPAWDTWVWYGQERTIPDPEEVRKTQESRRSYSERHGYNWEEWQPPESVSLLLCWIPPQFLAVVEIGILVNPVACLFWASDYKEHHFNTALMQQLEIEELLK